MYYCGPDCQREWMLTFHQTEAVPDNWNRLNIRNTPFPTSSTFSWRGPVNPFLINQPMTA